MSDEIKRAIAELIEIAEDDNQDGDTRIRAAATILEYSYMVDQSSTSSQS